MEYNPDKHHRRSIRLKGYDYSQEGMYFITMCVHGRKCLFGEIANGKMALNDAGKMVEKWYHELENKFSDIKCGEYVIMPNHFHCIIINTGHVFTVGADLCVCPNNITPINVCPNNIDPINVCPNNITPINVCSNNIDPHNIIENKMGENDKHDLGEHTGSPLHKIVQWFKTMSTNEYIRGVKTLDWQRFDDKLWQRNYWEHIIRDDQSFENISKYIINNPQKWDADKLR